MIIYIYSSYMFQSARQPFDEAPLMLLHHRSTTMKIPMLVIVPRGLFFCSLYLLSGACLILAQDMTTQAVVPIQKVQSFATVFLPAVKTSDEAPAPSQTDEIVVTETITYTIQPEPTVSSTASHDDGDDNDSATTSTTIEETTTTTTRSPLPQPPLPSPLPPMYPTPAPASTITVGWRGSVNRVHVFDPSLPTPTHSCPRDAVVAIAHWRDFCGTGRAERFCWTSAPSIRKCCGTWVHADDERYADYGRVMVARVETYVDDWDGGTRTRHYHETQTPFGAAARAKKVHVIQPGWQDYHMGDKVCRKWRPKNQGEFAFYMQNLDEFGLRDVDERGRINDGGYADGLFNGDYGDQTPDLDYEERVRDGV